MRRTINIILLLQGIIAYSYCLVSDDYLMENMNPEIFSLIYEINGTNVNQMEHKFEVASSLFGRASSKK